MAIRHQLAAYSPISARSVAAGVFGGAKSLERLGEVLRREYIADAAVLVDSGTHALQLALRIAARHVGSDPIVAFPAFSCYDLATAAVGAGSRVALYDLDPATLGPDEDSLSRVLRDGARIVVIAPLYGVPVGWDAIERLAAAHGALLIEDAAQGHGASWHGRRLGSLAPISTISFSRGKGWTGGQGGAVLLRGAFASKAETVPVASGRVRNLVGLAAQLVLGRPALYGIPRAVPGLGLGETRYHEPTEVTAMTGSAAAALLANRHRSLAEADQRRETGARLGAALQGAAGVRPIALLPGATPGYLRFPVRRPGGISGLAEPAVAQRHGVAPSYPMVLANLEPMTSRLVRPGKIPGAEELARDLMTLPAHSLLSDRDLREVVFLVTAST